MENVKLNTIEEAIEDFKAGNFVIVVDDEDRENEGESKLYVEACPWCALCSNYSFALQGTGFAASGIG